MKLLRVRCELATPAIVDAGPVHLDGILWAASAEHREAFRVEVPRLPVWSVTLFGETVALASALLPGHYRHQQVSLVKRRDGIDVQHLGGRLHRGLGPGKDKLRYALAIDGTLEWVVVAGRRRPVLKMLRRVLALGRDLRSGHGRVREWDVLEDPEEDLASVLVSPDSVSRRNLPPRWCSSSSAVSRGALRPPYWNQHVDIVPAGAVVRLDPAVLYEVRKGVEIAPRPRPADIRRALRDAPIQTED